MQQLPSSPTITKDNGRRPEKPGSPPVTAVKPASTRSWLGLRVQMALSYIIVSVVTALTLELLAASLALIFILTSSGSQHFLKNLTPASILGYVSSWAGSGLFWIVLTIPTGAIFGILTTRGIVQRIHRLVLATSAFAGGDYSQRVPKSRNDEIGQLESQFNTMAEQLIESIARQNVLIEQQTRLEERARIEQEMRTAQYIQRSLLPKELPTLPGWQLAPFYQPATEVGGDFYDILLLEDGQLGLVIGDVTGKGVPAALVMATTCTMLRSAAQHNQAPGEVLKHVNELLSMHIPEGMFATCFYGVLDPASGSLRYANAGHDWPYRRHLTGVSELRACGMPLGMLPGSKYDEEEVQLTPGESLLFYSDGLVEAHNGAREMFGLPHLLEIVARHPGGTELINDLRQELASFTGEGWEQEDDVTLVVMHRDAPTLARAASDPHDEQETWQQLAEWSIPSEPGNELQIIEQLEELLQPELLSGERLANLCTATAEAVMNAMEHGNNYEPDKRVTVQVLDSKDSVAVRVRDQGTEQNAALSLSEIEEPDLQAKLAEEDTPRGWGLFLIRNLVDELLITTEDGRSLFELIMRHESPVLKSGSATPPERG